MPLRFMMTGHNPLTRVCLQKGAVLQRRAITNLQDIGGPHMLGGSQGKTSN